jgi:hypothetical protein
MNCSTYAALVLTAAAITTTAQAQTAPSAAAPGKSAPVVSDSAPPPPEDRGSTGAIVLDPSPVRAVREAQTDGNRQGERKPTQTQGAGPLPPAAVRDALRGTGLDEPPPKSK